MNVEEIETIIQQIIQQIVAKQATNQLVHVGALPSPVTIPKPLKTAIHRVHWQFPDIETCQTLVIVYLTITQLSAIAQLQQIDQTTSFAVNYLLQGKKVFVLNTDCSLYQKKKSRTYKLWKKIQELWAQCQAYGVVLLTDAMVLQEYLSQPAKKQASAQKKKTFITEKELIRRQATNQQTLSEQEYLTPLAYDFAREHQLFLKEDERCNWEK